MKKDDWVDVIEIEKKNLIIGYVYKDPNHKVEDFTNVVITRRTIKWKWRDNDYGSF